MLVRRETSTGSRADETRRGFGALAGLSTASGAAEARRGGEETRGAAGGDASRGAAGGEASRGAAGGVASRGAADFGRGGGGCETVAFEAGCFLGGGSSGLGASGAPQFGANVHPSSSCSLSLARACGGARGPFARQGALLVRPRPRGVRGTTALRNPRRRRRRGALGPSAPASRGFSGTRRRRGRTDGCPPVGGARTGRAFPGNRRGPADLRHPRLLLAEPGVGARVERRLLAGDRRPPDRALALGRRRGSHGRRKRTCGHVRAFALASLSRYKRGRQSGAARISLFEFPARRPVQPSSSAASF